MYVVFLDWSNILKEKVGGGHSVHVGPRFPVHPTESLASRFRNISRRTCVLTRHVRVAQPPVGLQRGQPRVRSLLMGLKSALEDLIKTEVC
jgi:hypothetical protein